MIINLSLKRLVIPIFFDMLLRYGTVIINTIMVTNFNVKLVGAMAAGNQIMILFITIFSFLSVGCSVVIAQSLGAKNRPLALKSLHISITFNAILGLICSFFIATNAKFALEILKVPLDIIDESYKYLKILCIAMLIDCIGIVLAAVLRVYNHAFAVMTIGAIMNLITLFINSLVLFGFFGFPILGLEGVAISVIIGRVIALFCLFFTLIYIAKIRFYFKFLFAFEFDVLKKILSIGLPAAGENVLWMVQYLIAFSFVGTMGSDALSIHSIYFQISSLIFLGCSAVSMANEIIVGHLVGAKKFIGAYQRTFKSLYLSLKITLLVVALIFILKSQIMDLLNLQGEIRQIIYPLFYLSFILEIFRALNIVMVNALRATGDAKFPMYMGIIFMFFVGLPASYFFGIYLGFGVIGIWIGFCCDESLRGICNTLRWISKKWQTKRIV